MGNEAEKQDATMEEILASIRKIISDEEPAAAADVPDPANDAEDREVDDGIDPIAEMEAEHFEDPETMDTEPADEAPVMAEPEESQDGYSYDEQADWPPAQEHDDPAGQHDDEADSGDGDDLLETLSPFDPVRTVEAAMERDRPVEEDTPEASDPFDEPHEFTAAQRGAAAADEYLDDPIFSRIEPPSQAPEPRPFIPTAEAPRMNTSDQRGGDPLTDGHTANSAADSLSKLFRNMDVAGENTLEGLVTAMLRPMIKEWLDDNLPRIVEQRVDAEVSRIAHLARSGR